MESTTTACSSARSWALSRIEAGEPVSHVACDLGVHRDTLRRWRHEDGARPRPRRTSDERARLRADAVSMLREGMRPTDVARELGVCRPDVQRWAREEGLRQIDRLRQTVAALEQRAAAAEQRAKAAPPASSAKRTSPGSPPRSEEERLRIKLAELRKVQERTAQELRDQRKRSPWERITWALGMELGEVLPLTVMDALLAGETVRATFAHPRVDKHDRACDLVLRDEALPLFRLFAAHRESAELRDDDVESAARELERVEKERAASVGDDTDSDTVRATREAMSRNMRLERANGELAEVDDVAEDLLRARGKRLH